MSLAESLSARWGAIQGELLPFLREAVGSLMAGHRAVVTVLEMVRPEALLPHRHGLAGRPEAERAALGRAFVAKAVLNLATTRMLIERLQIDAVLRRLCGWDRLSELPSEATFSRAFAAFSRMELPSRLHEGMIKQIHEDRLVGHISRDATAIEGWERPRRRETIAAAPAEKRKRGRPRKGEERLSPKPPSRIERQASMTLRQMLEDLPRGCDVGAKRNAKGHQESWIGYKLHIDTADGDIPVSCVLSSASVHDSQVAIPLATMTGQRLVNLYDLMDSAYDVAAIIDHSRALGHVPVIAINPRRDKALKQELAQEQKRLTIVGHKMAEQVRYHQRTSAERVNANLKDNHGGRTVRVRGAEKVMCHLMFGILAVTVPQIFKLIQ